MWAVIGTFRFLFLWVFFCVGTFEVSVVDVDSNNLIDEVKEWLKFQVHMLKIRRNEQTFKCTKMHWFPLYTNKAIKIPLLSSPDISTWFSTLFYLIFCRNAMITRNRTITVELAERAILRVNQISFQSSLAQCSSLVSNTSH